MSYRNKYYSKKRVKNNDAKVLSTIITVFLFVTWLCTPPGNKFAQLCFYGNNTQYFIAKLTKTPEELNEWKFHRNNAIYLAKMDDKYASLKEINQAINTLPSYASDNEYSNLYSDRAQIRLYFREYKGALDDYLKVTDPSILDMFKIALLYKENGNNQFALSYCNNILNLDSNAYIGYACIADIYAGVGKYKTSVKIYDILISKRKNRAQYYADRSYYKTKAGDKVGALKDMEKAKELSPFVNKEITIIEETLRPKRLNLTIK